MNEPSTPPNVSGRALLIAWAKEQDDWVREVVGRVLETSAEPTPDFVDEVFGHMLIEKGLGQGTRTAGPTLVEQPASARDDPPLSLLAIEDVKNVNALADGQKITFNGKMTVLFGRNGSGKTGYSRILKRLSSVRREQKILPDITAASPSTTPPRARLRYSLGGQEAALEWEGAAGVPPFTRIDVFDAQEAPTYVDGELTYVYAPTDVALFRHVAKTVEEVRAKLDEAKRERAPGPNIYTQHFKRGVPFYAQIDTLGATTDLAHLRQLATVTSEEEASLEGLRVTSEALGGQDVQAQFRSAETELHLCSQALDVASALGSFDVEAHTRAVEELRAAQERQAAATRGAFADEALPGLMTDEWKAFIAAGERYIATHEGSEYPAPGEHCAYCRQPLTEAAVLLVKKYRDYCNGEHEKVAGLAKARLDSIAQPVSRLDLRSLEEAVRRNGESQASSSDALQRVADARLILNVAREAQRALAAPQVLAGGFVGQEVEATIVRLTAERTALSSRAVALKGKAEERGRALADVTARRDLLEARLTLRRLLDGLETFVEKSKWISVADGVLRKLKTTARTLTEASKQASEQLINHDFEKHFRDECKRLNAPHVNLDFKGQKGAAARRKQLRPEYKLTESLSEGEQKVIALADFLAEARLRTTNAPVVFDDPVTSLDYERIREVASRLAALARDRQVIVFTHNIWFVVELLERFRDRKTDCAYYDVRALDGRRGIVAGGTHPRSDSWGELRKRLNSTITEARKAAGETQDALISRGYAILRSLCEVAVETELLQDVVRRYEPNVRLTVLPKIKPAALKAAGEVIHPVYEEACRCIEAHSQPLEHLNIVGSIEDLARSFDAVQKAVETYRSAPT